MQERFNFDFGDVRIHTNAYAARQSRALGASAFTEGHDIAFAAQRYQPHTERGKRLIAHELTHVVQQARGVPGSTNSLEAMAQRAEHGQSLPLPGQGSYRPGLYMSRGDAKALVISINQNGSAVFTVEVEDADNIVGSGRASGMSRGEYRVRWNGDVMDILSASGEALDSSHNFNVTFDDPAVVTALQGATQAIPMYIVTVNSAPASTVPEHIQEFLGAEIGDRVSPNSAVMQRITEKLRGLTELELAEYKARTIGSTSSLLRFEEGLDRWLRELQQRKDAEGKHEEAARALYGMDDVYEMYQSWQLSRLMGEPPAWVAEDELLPVDQIPEDHCQRGNMGALYCRMRRALDQHGFANLAAFSTALEHFVTAFRDHAYFMGLEMLGRTESLLATQQRRYRDADTVTDLRQNLAPARAQFQEADRFREDAHARSGASWDPAAVSDFYRSGAEHRVLVQAANSLVVGQQADHPVVGLRGAPTESLARATTNSDTSRILNRYISERLEDVRNTRRNLSSDRELVFHLDILMARARASQGIDDGSIWDKALKAHVAPTLEESLIEAAIIVFAIAAGLASGGTGTLATLAVAGSLGASSYLAIREYEQYATQSDAYGAQLLSQEPSLTWLVLSIVGVVADLALVGRIIRSIRPALSSFQRTGNIVELEASLVNVEERIRRSILAGAEQELQRKRAWQSILRPNPTMLRGSFFGLDIVAQATYATFLSLRRGVNNFKLWALSDEAVSLIGDINRLSPEDLLRVKELYGQAISNMQRVADHGRQIGMSLDDIDDALLAWARRGTGTTDDVIASMNSLVQLRTRFQTWTAGLPTRAAPASNARYTYQITHTGATETRVAGGGVQIWADGTRLADQHLLEAKFIGNPGRSPYIAGSGIPDFIRAKAVADVTDEFRRYGLVINDATTHSPRPGSYSQ